MVMITSAPLGSSRGALTFPVGSGNGTERAVARGFAMQGPQVWGLDLV